MTHARELMITYDPDSTLAQTLSTESVAGISTRNRTIGDTGRSRSVAKYTSDAAAPARGLDRYGRLSRDVLRQGLLSTRPSFSVGPPAANSATPAASKNRQPGSAAITCGGFGSWLPSFADLRITSRKSGGTRGRSRRDAGRLPWARLSISVCSDPSSASAVRCRCARESGACRVPFAGPSWKGRNQ